MNWTLEKVMLSLNEAMFNLSKDYPNKDQAQQAYGALTNYTNYTPPKVVLIPHGLEEPGPFWMEVVELGDWESRGK